MKLENQVCSLDLAKRLKELGVKQESYFTWIRIISLSANDHIGVHPSDWLKEKDISFDESYAAFTVAELGEMLPDQMEDQTIPATVYLLSGKGTSSSPWVVWYGNVSHEGHSEVANTEADARAKMLIYLIENKLIEV